MTPSLSALTVTACLLGSVAFAAPACTAAQDTQAATVAAATAAKEKLSAAAFLYRLQYDNVGYDVNVQSAAINGNQATVRGLLTLRATQRRDGRPVGGTYRGTVSLTRTGPCAWQATRYQQENGQ